jgi:hypothetical protein
MARKPAAKPKPKLTDAERHKRFVAMAREVDASDDPKDFERAFTNVVSSAKAVRPVSSRKRA